MDRKWLPCYLSNDMNSNPTQRTIANLLDNPTVSFWLKARLRELKTRDCLDMARDAALFAEIAKARLDEQLTKG